MDYLECHIGNMDMFLPASERLIEVMLKTNAKLNYAKHIAKMRKSYYGGIHDAFIFLSPTYIYALEESLEELGYINILHTTILSYSRDQQLILYTLLREGKSVRFLKVIKGFSIDEITKTVQSLFEKISSIIRS